MTRKLIVTDLDGTSLHDESSLNPITAKALLEAQEAGHVVCIATGRPKRATMKFYNELGLDTIMANYNGSHISNPSDVNYDGITVTISHEIVREIFNNQIILDGLKDAMCEFKDTVFAYDYTNIFLQWFHGEGAQKTIGDLGKIVTTDVNSVLLLLETDRSINELSRVLEQYPFILQRRWSVKPNEPMIIEVNPMGGNKGMALKEMASFYNIALEDTYCFGDMNNDLEMMYACPNSVAVGNATPELKEAATHVMEEKNIDGAVGLFINKYILKK